MSLRVDVFNSDSEGKRRIEKLLDFHFKDQILLDTFCGSALALPKKLEVTQ